MCGEWTLGLLGARGSEQVSPLGGGLSGWAHPWAGAAGAAEACLTPGLRAAEVRPDERWMEGSRTDNGAVGASGPWPAASPPPPAPRPLVPHSLLLPVSGSTGNILGDPHPMWPLNLWSASWPDPGRCSRGSQVPGTHPHGPPRAAVGCLVTASSRLCRPAARADGELGAAEAGGHVPELPPGCDPGSTQGPALTCRFRAAPQECVCLALCRWDRCLRKDELRLSHLLLLSPGLARRCLPVCSAALRALDSGTRALSLGPPCVVIEAVSSVR